MVLTQVFSVCFWAHVADKSQCQPVINSRYSCYRPCFYWCRVFRCWWRLELTVKLLSHVGHWYGCSSVWVLWCLVRSPLWLNPLRHSEQMYGFRSLWVHSWRLRLPCPVNCFLHTWHYLQTTPLLPSAWYKWMMYVVREPRSMKRFKKSGEFLLGVTNQKEADKLMLKSEIARVRINIEPTGFCSVFHKCIRFLCHRQFCSKSLIVTTRTVFTATFWSKNYLLHYDSSCIHGCPTDIAESFLGEFVHF